MSVAVQSLTQRRAACGRGLGTVPPLPPAPQQHADDHDKPDLQQQAKHRGYAAEAAAEAVAEQHAEQARADEARGEAAEQSAAEQAARPRSLTRGRGVLGRAWLGCAMVRSIGRAAFGAVAVEGGAE